MKQRTEKDIYALINKGETFHLECKKAQGGLPSSLWESYSAFCNADGGVILLGVKARPVFVGTNAFEGIFIVNLK